MGDWSKGQGLGLRYQLPATNNPQPLTEATPALGAILTQRRAGLEASTAAPAQTVNAHAGRRHLAMDRGLQGHEREDVGHADADRAARGAPCLNPGDELAE